MNHLTSPPPKQRLPSQNLPAIYAIRRCDSRIEDLNDLRFCGGKAIWTFSIVSGVEKALLLLRADVAF
jgi:hypothetical protein